MRLLLDTNVIIALIALEPSVVRRLNAHHPDDVVTSSIAMFELIHGAMKSARRAKNLKVIGDLGLQVLDFNAEDARVAGETRSRLEQMGTPIGPYDVLIAGQALARDLTLVTRNTREFIRVDGLRLENWGA